MDEYPLITPLFDHIICHGSQRCRCISTCPLLLKTTPSSSNKVRCRLHPGAVRPSLFTTRWQGSPSAPGEYRKVRPTIREWLGHPANAAIYLSLIHI